MPVNFELYCVRRVSQLPDEFQAEKLNENTKNRDCIIKIFSCNLDVIFNRLS